MHYQRSSMQRCTSIGGAYDHQIPTECRPNADRSLTTCCALVVTVRTNARSIPIAAITEGVCDALHHIVCSRRLDADGI